MFERTAGLEALGIHTYITPTNGGGQSGRPFVFQPSLHTPGLDVLKFAGIRIENQVVIAKGVICNITAVAIGPLDMRLDQIVLIDVQFCARQQQKYCVRRSGAIRVSVIEPDSV